MTLMTIIFIFALCNVHIHFFLFSEDLKTRAHKQIHNANEDMYIIMPCLQWRLRTDAWKFQKNHNLRTNLRTIFNFQHVKCSPRCENHFKRCWKLKIGPAVLKLWFFEISMRQSSIAIVDVVLDNVQIIKQEKKLFTSFFALTWEILCILILWLFLIFHL
jgi:hypothetical protein